MISHPCVKVNLGLNVLRKRSDGYHDLETLFLPYPGIHDTLEIIKGDDFSQTSASLFERYGDVGSAIAPEDRAALGIVRGRGPLPAMGGAERSETSIGGSMQTLERIVQAIREDGKVMITIARAEGVDWDPLNDLTAKAYYLLDRDFNLPPVKIFLEKTSPVGAGLGGGSADAAFALRMMSELFGLGLDDESLAAYAARLGSDCSFFVYCRPMIGEGRGEILTPFEDIQFEMIDAKAMVAGHELRVVVPDGISVSTREAYGGIVPREASAAGAALPSLREALAQPVERWRDFLVNDFEATVFAVHPELAAIKQRMYDGGAVYAAMSGSGSALFELR